MATNNGELERKLWAAADQLTSDVAKEILDYALLSQAIYRIGTPNYTAVQGWEMLDCLEQVGQTSDRAEQYSSPIRR